MSLKSEFFILWTGLLMNYLKLSVLFGFLVFLSGCGSSSNGLGNAIDDAVDQSACSVVGQNRFVYEVMQDIYFWNTFLPTVDPDTYTSPEALLQDIRYAVLDSTFSSIVDEVDNTLFFEQGQYVGVGVSLRTIGDQVFIGQVFSDSPADQAGFLRGFEILEINGQAVAGLIATDGVSDAFGPDEEGTQVDLRYRDLQGNELTVTIAKALATIQPVPLTRVFDINGVKTGYLNFRTFIEPSYTALNNAFASFRSQGVTELILDMRYNGGGRVAVAEHLGGLIGGSGTSGQVYSNWVHNANNAVRNRTSLFPNPFQSLGLSRLVVITTSSTASASELVINALRPYIPVVLIGSTTFGKPVGSYGFPFCGKVLNPIAFNLRNADDQGDYYDGLAVDCSAEDELSQPFGDPAEDSTAEALFYVENGVCSTAVQSYRTEGAAREPSRPVSREDWQVLRGAY